MSTLAKNYAMEGFTLDQLSDQLRERGWIPHPVQGDRLWYAPQPNHAGHTGTISFVPETLCVWVERTCHSLSDQRPELVLEWIDLYGSPMRCSCGTNEPARKYRLPITTAEALGFGTPQPRYAVLCPRCRVAVEIDTREEDWELEPH